MSAQEADIKGYESLSPEYRAKLLAALQRQQGHGGAGAPGMPVEVTPLLVITRHHVNVIVVIASQLALGLSPDVQCIC